MKRWTGAVRKFVDGLRLRLLKALRVGAKPRVASKEIICRLDSSTATEAIVDREINVGSPAVAKCNGHTDGIMVVEASADLEPHASEYVGAPSASGDAEDSTSGKQAVAAGEEQSDAALEEVVGDIVSHTGCRNCEKPKQEKDVQEPALPADLDLTSETSISDASPDRPDGCDAADAIEQDHSFPQEPNGALPSEDARSQSSVCGGQVDGVEASSAEPVAKPPKPMAPRKAAVHRDRRGNARNSGSAERLRDPPNAARSSSTSKPGEAWFRLALHPIRQTVKLSLVLSRPQGFPGRTVIAFNGGAAIDAYDDKRYDDVDVEWSDELLREELRVDGADGIGWVRGKRRFQLFAADAGEPDLISVGSARAGIDHAIICTSEDVAAVCAIAVSTGSPEPLRHNRWKGVPDGWEVLSGYVPTRATAQISDAAFSPLDPGFGTEIVLSAGLTIGPRVFAEGHPPRIEIHPMPDGAVVRIGGQDARVSADGVWEAQGWDAPGRHTIDVVPGPSLTYEIVGDPANADGWEFWNAHESRSGGLAVWSRAEICGARVAGPGGEIVLAVAARESIVALGAERGATHFQVRADVGASIALLPEPPAFLFISSGSRRNQGWVLWLAQRATSPVSNETHGDLAWANAVHSAASRRVPLVGADDAGKLAWRNAVRLSRNVRRRRR